MVHRAGAAGPANRVNGTINTALAEIAADSGGLLQFYVVRHNDYAALVERAEEGDTELRAVCALMSAIARGLSDNDQAANCLLCERLITFRGSGGVAIVGGSPISPGTKCVFRLFCAPCGGVSDPELMKAVTDRWRVLVTPSLRVLPPAHEAGRA